MIVGSIKENIDIEKRVSITPETAKNILSLGLQINLEKNYAEHLGISDEDYKKVGANFFDSSSEVLKNSNLILKVNCPTEDEVKNLKENQIIIGVFNPSKNENVLKNLAKKKFKNIFSRTSSKNISCTINGCFIIPIQLGWL